MANAPGAQVQGALMNPSENLTRFTFVVFSDDWGRHPSSCQHLFKRIVPKADVIWVNTVGLRVPRLSLYDVKRGMQVLASWLRPRKAAPGGDAAGAPGEAAMGSAPKVLRPAMWPSFRSRWSAALNQRLLSRAVHKALNGTGRKEIILVSTLPIVPALFKDAIFRKKIYYCVDDFTEWHGVDGEAMRRLEQGTLAACDLLIATSSPILESRGGSARAATLLTHGVDVAHFSGAVANPLSPLAKLRKPIVGLFGVFDRRIDADLVKACARALPQASFAVVGPLVDRDAGEFADVPNLHFLGAMPYRDLPGHVAHFDVCMLPYVIDKTTRNINPLKLKEYLATGKPVIATPLPEAAKLGAYLTLAEPGRFVAELERLLVRLLARPPARPQGLDAFLAGESWDAKAERFLAAILAGL